MIYMYIYIGVCMYSCVPLIECVCKCVFTSIPACVYAFVLDCVWQHMRVRVCVSLCVCECALLECALQVFVYECMSVCKIALDHVNVCISQQSQMIFHIFMCFCLCLSTQHVFT